MGISKVKVVGYVVTVALSSKDVCSLVVLLPEDKTVMDWFLSNPVVNYRLSYGADEFYPVALTAFWPIRESHYTFLELDDKYTFAISASLYVRAEADARRRNVVDANYKDHYDDEEEGQDENEVEDLPEVPEGYEIMFDEEPVLKYQTVYIHYKGSYVGRAGCDEESANGKWSAEHNLRLSLLAFENTRTSCINALIAAHKKFLSEKKK